MRFYPAIDLCTIQILLDNLHQTYVNSLWYLCWYLASVTRQLLYNMPRVHGIYISNSFGFQERAGDTQIL